MPTVDVPAQLTVAHLMAAIKQLSASEWQELQRQLREWRGDTENDEEPDVLLLSTIQNNSRLPEASQGRFDHLRRGQQENSLTSQEEAELQALWGQVEEMNVIRLKALTNLARRRKTDVRSLLRELGLAAEPGVF